MDQQPIPQVTADDVIRIVRRDFPPEEQAEVLRELEGLGAAAKPRVQLAVLKLIQGKLDALPRHIAMAKQDWRDVLMYAEYPADARISWGRPPEDHHGAYQADWEQYQDWLRRENR